MINEAGLELIKRFEGCRLEAYLDSVGVATIGYGHTSGVELGQTITQEQADQFLIDDLVTAEKCVKSAVPFGLTDNQYAALVSFAFNLGCGALRGSTLLRKLQSGDDGGAADEFGRWCHAGGRALPGLVARRAAEANLFLAC